jgi:hypothetical protein
MVRETSTHDQQTAEYITKVQPTAVLVLQQILTGWLEYWSLADNYWLGKFGET